VPIADPVTQALSVTDIVVGAAVTALLLAFTVQIRKRCPAPSIPASCATCGADVDRLVPLLLAMPLLAAALVRVPAVWRGGGSRAPSRSGAPPPSPSSGCALVVAAHDAPVVHWVGGWGPRDGQVIGIAFVADGLAAGYLASPARPSPPRCGTPSAATSARRACSRS
jgi:hypothetical protein